MLNDNALRARVIGKARKNGLFELEHNSWDALPEKTKKRLAAASHFSSEPIVVFIGGDSLWTILSESEVSSFHNDRLHHCKLGNRSISKISQMESHGEKQTRNKRKSDFLILEPAGIKVWVPRGEEIFSLWNVLLVFT